MARIPIQGAAWAEAHPMKLNIIPVKALNMKSIMLIANLTIITCVIVGCGSNHLPIKPEPSMFSNFLTNEETDLLFHTVFIYDPNLPGSIGSWKAQPAWEIHSNECLPLTTTYNVIFRYPISDNSSNISEEKYQFQNNVVVYVSRNYSNKVIENTAYVFMINKIPKCLMQSTFENFDTKKFRYKNWNIIETMTYAKP
jgi:hypothetical protein